MRHPYWIAALAVTPLLGQAHPDGNEAHDRELQSFIALLNTPIRTASKRVQQTIDSPQAIEVVTAEQIRASGAFRLMDVLKLMTNLQVWDMDGQISRTAMRGVTPGGSPKTIQVLVDGAPLYNTEAYPIDIEGIPVPLDAIDRVEIVRGPSSSLYGANAQLGVISITTKKAWRPSEGTFRVAGTQNHGFRAQATYLHSGGPFSITAAAGTHSNRKLDEPYHALGVPHQTYLPNNQYHQQQVFVRPEWQPSKDCKVWAMFGHSKKLTGPEANITAVPIQLSPTFQVPAYARLYILGFERYQTSLAQVGWEQNWSPTLVTSLKINHLSIPQGGGGGLHSTGDPWSPTFVNLLTAALPVKDFVYLSDPKSHEPDLIIAS